MPILATRRLGQPLGRVRDALGALSRAPDVTGPTPPGIGPAVYDISPLLLYQLVPELECWKACAEGVLVLPSSRRSRLALPMDEDLAHAVCQASADNAVRFRNRSAIVDGRKRRRSYRRETRPFF